MLISAWLLEWQPLRLPTAQPLGVAAAHGDHRLGHQRIVDDDVGFHQVPLGAQRQQVFGAWTGADQRHIAVADAPPAHQF